MKDIISTVRDGRTIDAIKMFRDRYSTSLVEAKRAIDDIRDSTLVPDTLSKKEEAKHDKFVVSGMSNDGEDWYNVYSDIEEAEAAARGLANTGFKSLRVSKVVSSLEEVITYKLVRR